MQPKVKVVVYESEADNSAKKITQLVLAVQYRHKKQCTNCQDHEKMESLSKKKLKEQLQRKRQTERNNKKSNSWLRGYRKIVYIRKDDLLFLVIDRRKRICNSQSKD